MYKNFLQCKLYKIISPIFHMILNRKQNICSLTLINDIKIWHIIKYKKVIN